jgi:hypothetical protein
MKLVHVPDVVRTDCFSECRIGKVIESAAADPIYVMQYHCRSLEGITVTGSLHLPFRRSTPIDFVGAEVLASSSR